MRYKGDYKPQYVLDFDNLEWQPLNDELKALMDIKKYASVSKEQRQREQANGSQTSPDISMSDADVSHDDVKYPTPLEAMNSGLSLLELGAPGVLTQTQLENEVALDEMKVFANGGVFRTSVRDNIVFFWPEYMADVDILQAIVSWSEGSILDSRSLKGAFAELAATIGPRLASEIIVDFS